MTTISKQQEDAKRIVSRLGTEFASASQSWALFEAMNGRDGQHRADMHGVVNHLRLADAYMGTMHALARDTLLTLMRMTDAPADDTLTLCKLSKYLEAEVFRNEIVEGTRRAVVGGFKDWSDDDAAACAAKIKSFTDLVPSSWKSMTLPADARLLNLRTKLRPVRDNTLAHVIDTTGVLMPAADEISELLNIVGDAVDDVQLVFLGWSALSKDAHEARLREAMEFWDICQDGVVLASGSLT